MGVDIKRNYIYMFTLACFGCIYARSAYAGLPEKLAILEVKEFL
jgi:hypothetical protein